LQAAARALVAGHGGRFPRDPAALARLPGLGPYTAAAVAAFAFNLPTAPVDGNIARVIARLTGFREPVDRPAGRRVIAARAAALVPPGRSRLFNSALMELGQRICQPRAPRCGECPVASHCAARDADPASLPVLAPRPKVSEVDEHTLFARRGEQLLLHLESGRRRRGLWKLPERPASAVAGLPLLLETRYAITRYRVCLRVYRAGDAETAGPGESWLPLAGLASLPMPAPFRRALDRILAGIHH
jgi:A/G-specific adenine glycosylase